METFCCKKSLKIKTISSLLRIFKACSQSQVGQLAQRQHMIMTNQGWITNKVTQ